MGCVTSRSCEFPDTIHPNIFTVYPVSPTLLRRRIIGKLEITEQELILHQKGGPPCHWPYQYLRRYGFEPAKNYFTFESGRRCESGAGVFTFRCRQAMELFLMVQSFIQSASNANDFRAQLSHLRVQSFQRTNQLHAESSDGHSSGESQGQFECDHTYLRPDVNVPIQPQFITLPSTKHDTLPRQTDHNGNIPATPNGSVRYMRPQGSIRSIHQEPQICMLRTPSQNQFRVNNTTDYGSQYNSVTRRRTSPYYLNTPPEDQMSQSMHEFVSPQPINLPANRHSMSASYHAACPSTPSHRQGSAPSTPYHPQPTYFTADRYINVSPKHNTTPNTPYNTPQPNLGGSSSQYIYNRSYQPSPAIPKRGSRAPIYPKPLVPPRCYSVDQSLALKQSMTIPDVPAETQTAQNGELKPKRHSYVNICSLNDDSPGCLEMTLEYITVQLDAAMRKRNASMTNCSGRNTNRSTSSSSGNSHRSRYRKLSANSQAASENPEDPVQTDTAWLASYNYADIDMHRTRALHQTANSLQRPNRNSTGHGSQQIHRPRNSSIPSYDIRRY